MHARCGSTIVAGLFIIALGASAEAAAQCTKDTECLGEQLCVRGRCVDPMDATAPPPAARPPAARPAPAPPRCTKDVDCVGEQLCVRGRCVAPAAPPAPAPRRCTKDVECAGDDLCVKGTCVRSEGPATGQPGAPAASAPPAGATGAARAPAGPPPAPTAGPDFDPLAVPNGATPGSKLQERAHGGFVTGYVMGGAGLILFVAGMGVWEQLGSTALAIADAGTLLMITGSWVGAIALTVRHNAIRDAGYDVGAAPIRTTWALTIGATLLYAGAVPLSVYGWKKDDFGLMMGSLGMWIGATCLAAGTLLVLPRWARELAQAPRKDAATAAPSVRLVPSVYAARDGAGTQRYFFGVAGAF